MMVLSSVSTSLIQDMVCRNSLGLPVFVRSPAWMRMSHFGRGVRKIGAVGEGVRA